MKTEKTWLLVADGAQAGIFHYEGPKKGLVAVKNGVLTHSGSREKTSELMTDGRGRVQNRVGAQRSAMEAPTDPQENEKHKFTIELVEFITRREAQFTKLIIAAPAKMLGDLRKELPDNIKSRVIKEISKDLTKISIEELPDHLDGLLPVHDHKVDHFNKKYLAG